MYVCSFTQSFPEPFTAYSAQIRALERRGEMMARFIKKLFSKGQMSGTYDLSGTQSGIILPSPDYPIYRISHSRGECARVSSPLAHSLEDSYTDSLVVAQCVLPFCVSFDIHPHSSFGVHRMCLRACVRNWKSRLVYVPSSRSVPRRTCPIVSTRITTWNYPDAIP